MKIAIILGTRPEIIKLSPIIKGCIEESLNYFVIHTNQHYSKDMGGIFFEDLELPKAKYNLNVGSGPHGKQTGLMLERIEEILLKEKPSIVIVQGDTNSAMAGALAASKLHIKIAHVEAGLRSYDREMPEEINRIITDHISDYLFCPTQKQQDILLKEGISKEKIYVVGNTIVDAVEFAKNIANEKMLCKFNLKPKQFILLTMHRPSNVDNEGILRKHLENISNLARKKNLNVIFPIHPRTKKNIEKFNIEMPKVIKTIEPIGFIDLIALEKYAMIILTDSGGIQEEACILGVPSLNLRENTERPECVEVGASKIVGDDFQKMKEGFAFFSIERKWGNPFGENIYKKIVNSLK